VNGEGGAGGQETRQEQRPREQSAGQLRHRYLLI
jgi:hypothetical protein